jgi:hypothetical protein
MVFDVAVGNLPSAGDYQQQYRPHESPANDHIIHDVVDAVGIYHESLPVEGDRRNVPCGDIPNCLQKTPAAELQEGTIAAGVRIHRSHLRVTRRT